MTHQHEDVEIHHDGDHQIIDVTVEDSDGSLVNLLGASAEWLLFESPVFDADDEAVLVKEGEEGETDEIEFTAPEDGELEVPIETGDTEGLVDWGEEFDEDVDDPSVDFHHRLRVTSDDGHRWTVLHGTFTIYR